MTNPSEEKISKYLSTLMKWGKRNLRTFPWRLTKDPYKILVAEIMLQRTKAEQVVLVFNRFICSFPNMEILNKASLAEIEEIIQPLGLKKRGAYIKQLAQQVCQQYDGRVPNNRTEILSLLGVGNYVANAVLCYAFDQRLPTVDSNFARILDRVFTLQLTKGQKDRRLWTFSEEMLSRSKVNCRTFNLATLDFGYLICTPKKPKCSKCPINSICDYAARLLPINDLGQG